jgi:predicted dehydrogenase
MKAIVIGYGSIGKRHATILKDMGIETAVVSRREVDFPLQYSDLESAIKVFGPQLIVIANKTNEHYSSLNEIIKTGWKGKILVEKPLFHKAYKFLLQPGVEVFVAYNLRFHPGIQRLRSEIQTECIISVMAYVGQYLPSWRPDRDYRESYSSKLEEGGGVLRDLSHELDYITWLFGRWRRITAVGGHFSSLEISSDDCWGILVETEFCPIVSLQMNYLDRPGRREIVVVTDKHTYKLDLYKGIFEIDGRIDSFEIKRNETYLNQYRSLLNGNLDMLCSWEEGNNILRMLEAIETSKQRQEWIWNEEVMYDLR